MPQEIERKYLVNKKEWEAFDKPVGKTIKQAYLLNEIEKTIRVRIKGDKGFLTIKGKTEGVTRTEFEYEIPFQDAEQLMKLYGKQSIEKVRYEITIANHIWEVDVFEGKNDGLIVAEIELQNENEAFEIPHWVAQEVSDDARYYNANLIHHPFKSW